MIHTLLALFFLLALVGLILWGIGKLPGIPEPVKIVIYVIVGVVLLSWIYRHMGEIRLP